MPDGKGGHKRGRSRRRSDLSRVEAAQETGAEMPFDPDHLLAVRGLSPDAAINTVWALRNRMARNAPQGMSGAVITEEHVRAFAANRGLEIPVTVLDAVIDADIIYRDAVLNDEEDDT